MDRVARYIQQAPPARRPALARLRTLVEAGLPGARETFRHRMPTYEAQAFLCAFANQQRHISFYVCDPGLLDRFRGRLVTRSLGRSCIRFRALDPPLERVIVALLAELARRHGLAVHGAGPPEHA